MSKKLGVLINGAGWVSTQHIQAFKNNPNTQVVAISDIKIDIAQSRATEFGLDVKCYDDFDKALKHPGVDIVSICTPQHIHPENAIAAAKAGKHMVIEKPAAMTIELAKSMGDAINKVGVKSIVSFVARWNPLFKTLKSMIADGAFGRIYSVEADYCSYRGDWSPNYEVARQKEFGGSAFLVGGCHAIDAMRWFAAPGEYKAADPVEVFAYEGGLRGRSTNQYNPKTNTWHEGNPLEYAGLEMALVRFSNGVLGKVSVNYECIQPYAFPFRIYGDKGTVKDNKIWSHKFPGQNDWIEIPAIGLDSSDVTHHPFQGEMDHFVDCILKDTESHCNFADALKTHEIIFAAQRCYETGKPVKLPLISSSS